MSDTFTSREDSSTKPNGRQITLETPDGAVRMGVRMEQETVWMTQKQMATAFSTSTQNVSTHLKNIFSDGELSKEETTKQFPVVPSDGQQVGCPPNYYNLDAITAVAYRVNPKGSLSFRQWATHTLRQHLVRGYTLNKSRLTESESGLREARQMIDLLTRTLCSQELVNDTGKVVLELVSNYADTWRLLRQYDENRLEKPTDGRPSTRTIELDQAVDAIIAFKSDLAANGEPTELFGKPCGDALAAILGAIEQTMFGEPLYRSREEKAAHLLYFLVKDHPFTDGNKRIGALLFLLYLTQEGIPHKFDHPALTPLTLLIAASRPADKELMVRLIMNLLLPFAE